jgi:hypothetical protein
MTVCPTHCVRPHTLHTGQAVSHWPITTCGNACAMHVHVQCQSIHAVYVANASSCQQPAALKLPAASQMHQHCLHATYHNMRYACAMSKHTCSGCCKRFKLPAANCRPATSSESDASALLACHLPQHVVCILCNAKAYMQWVLQTLPGTSSQPV